MPGRNGIILGVDDAALRHQIYRHFADTGDAPTLPTLAQWVGGEPEARRALHRLHDAHAVVLDEDGTIQMALPFSAVPTAHKVVAGDRSWFANCAWDSLAIPAALDIDAVIESEWLDTGEPVELAISDGRLRHTDGFIHFAVPARHWWDDIVET